MPLSYKRSHREVSRKRVPSAGRRGGCSPVPPVISVKRKRIHDAREEERKPRRLGGGEGAVSDERKASRRDRPYARPLRGRHLFSANCARIIGGCRAVAFQSRLRTYTRARARAHAYACSSRVSPRE